MAKSTQTRREFLKTSTTAAIGIGLPAAIAGRQQNASPNDKVPWATGPNGSMFGVSRRYLKRSIDYRSVLGKLIRDHLGATQEQLDRIIPGYAVPTEFLKNGGLSTKDATQIMGEVPLV